MKNSASILSALLAVAGPSIASPAAFAARDDCPCAAAICGSASAHQPTTVTVTVSVPATTTVTHYVSATSAQQATTEAVTSSGPSEQTSTMTSQSGATPPCETITMTEYQTRTLTSGGSTWTTTEPAYTWTRTTTSSFEASSPYSNTQFTITTPVDAQTSTASMAEMTTSSFPSMIPSHGWNHTVPSKSSHSRSHSKHSKSHSKSHTKSHSKSHSISASTSHSESHSKSHHKSHHKSHAESITASSMVSRNATTSITASSVSSTGSVPSTSSASSSISRSMSYSASSTISQSTPTASTSSAGRSSSSVSTTTSPSSTASSISSSLPVAMNTTSPSSTTQQTTSSFTTSSQTACATTPEKGTYCGFINPEDPCAPQPDGYGPVPTPDTVSAFQAYPPFHAEASAAPILIPSNNTRYQYERNFTDLTASVSTSNYITVYDLHTYSAAECAAKCDETVFCKAFNIYVERDPSVNPSTNASTAPTVWGRDCPNPASITNYKCALWGTEIDESVATNYGDYREQFHVVIAGSDGYNLI